MKFSPRGAESKKRKEKRKKEGIEFLKKEREMEKKKERIKFVKGHEKQKKRSGRRKKPSQKGKKK